MAPDQRTASTLTTALSNVVADIAELAQKEFQLARTEIGQKLAAKVRGGYWMLAAALLLLLAAAVFVQAVVIWMVTLGLAPQVACLIVTAFLVALAAGAYATGRGEIQENLTPDRSIHQIKEDVRSTKEQLT